ncbi:MAG: hypothetical protein UW86_C0002G0040 [Microgenomates group bacterium GW2011_GWA1_Microgenomates_45_10]|nr:MAG: hypothetical protein UW69_C0016G0010 [Microgenomates group bacterium GW2011_GWA2_44_7]KKT78099.1 MAG: hypothetical protein UW73_C0007G0040 [Microgenomates group bacterium GW2011_GWB1_44_8]KKT87436.1 MAG: hypothetical protein UW86_C0002G0040 [Microgenomates group bacterium GW2011_GWA1_Microgenomates_45_10]
MLNTVKCPKCGQEVEISEALTHQIEEQVVASEKEKHQAELQELEKKLSKKAQIKAEEDFRLQFKQQQDELVEQKERNQKLIDQLTELTKTIRELKQKDEERQLEMEKKLAETQENIRQEALKRSAEEHQLKDAEKDKKLQDAQIMIEELKRKVQQGSQQTQGEVLELELEQILTSEFPNDKITPVSKGVRGADVVQEVWDRNGNRCGTILWESKNARWTNDWLEKLKEDQRRIKADDAALVSENLTDDIHSAGYKDGVWICHRRTVLGLAYGLRGKIIDGFHIRRSLAGKDEKKEILYNYLTGVEFRQRIEAIINAFTGMQEEIEKERRWFQSKWARQERHLRNVLDHTHGMHGDLQAIVGNTLPEIKSLQSPTASITETPQDSVLDSPQTTLLDNE